jgi:hypothetical protein
MDVRTAKLVQICTNFCVLMTIKKNGVSSLLEYESCNQVVTITELESNSVMS